MRDRGAELAWSNATRVPAPSRIESSHRHPSRRRGEESDGDLIGDGVNIAARLEGIREPGGDLISGTPTPGEMADRLGFP